MYIVRVRTIHHVVLLHAVHEDDGQDVALLGALGVLPEAAQVVMQRDGGDVGGREGRGVGIQAGLGH